MDDDDIEDIYIDNDSSRPAPHHPVHHQPYKGVESPEEYKKFQYILIGILVVSAALTTVRGWELRRFLADFIAIFLVTFASFKFLDNEAFAWAYRQYDIVASRLRPWAYAVPFVQAFLGFWYLLSEGPFKLNLLAIAFVGVGGYGVLQRIRSREKLPTAGLSKYVRIPLIQVSLVEDLTMLALMAVMLALSL